MTGGGQGWSQDADSRGWDFVLMVACLESMGARVVDDSSAVGLAQGLESLARCVVEQPETVIQLLRKLLPAAVRGRCPAQ